MEGLFTLKCTSGVLAGKEWHYSKEGFIKIGRANRKVDLDIYVPPKTEAELSIARINTLIYVSSQKIYVRDMGSAYGTYINGKRINSIVDFYGKSPEEAAAVPGDKKDDSWTELSDGDSIGIGMDGKVIIFKICIKRELSLLEQAYLQLDQILHELLAGKNPEKIVEEYCVKEPEDSDGTMETTIIKPKHTPLVYNVYENFPIGKGGFASVFLGENPDTGEKYAVKRYTYAYPVTDMERLRIEREAKIGTMMEHPNVVKSYHMSKRDNGFDIVMEYCDGGSLNDLVKNHGPMAVDEATTYILQALDGLIYLHDLEYYVPGANQKEEIYYGVAHRDIKPENLMLKNEHGKTIVKIGDYGLSKAYELAGRSLFTIDGAPGYFSEYYCSRLQILNYKYAHPYVDVFSMAATYYYLLTGKTVRDIKKKESYDNLYKYILKEDVIPIRKANRHIPEALAKVIDGVLNEDTKPSEYKTIMGLRKVPESAAFTTAKEFRQRILDAAGH